MSMRRAMEIVTPLGQDVLLFHRMTSSEEISRLSEFEIDLLSAKGDIAPNKILGKNVTVKLELHDGSTRHFNGYVTRFQQVGVHGRYHAYHATVRPWLWFLTRTADCRIFQEKTVPEIIKQVFSDHSIADIKDELTYTYRKRTYCVQYRETDFNFVSRLMEEEGIYYFFTHAEERHTLVLADAYSAHAPAKGYETLQYIASERLVRPEQEYISQWNNSCEIQSGKYEIDDYDFERPSVELAVRSKMAREHALSDYEIYDYPGEYLKTADGEQYVDARIDELQARFEIARGESNARGLAPGRLFKLTGQPRADQNREYLILSAGYNLAFNAYETGEAQGVTCTCGFSALNSKQQFRPRRITPQPTVQGPQTAVVVGPSGDEIYTDKYGRVKVQFHWDRYGKQDEKSSCWVRPSHPWAGNKWGMIATPRIGQEVIVDFLEGDPDQPIITGRVYNAESMPPYALPANATMTALKSNSSKGGGGFNEIRLEDKKGAEQLFFHAERNQDIRVKNDTFEWIGNEQHLIVKADQLEQIEGDKHLTVKGDSNAKVSGTVSLDAGMDLQQKVGTNHALDAGMEIHLKAGMNVVIEAGVSITLKAGGGFIVVGPAGVTISGTPVLINSGGSAGSGSGCSPDAAKPPKEAANAKPGSVNDFPVASAPKSIPAAPPPGGFTNPQAQTLAQAAQNGTPFCEKCEAARRAQAQQSAA